jgi:P pilus assembly chaperone PapD
MRKKYGLIQAIIGITTLAPALLFAAGISISVSPIRVNHMINKGEQGTDTISVKNDGTVPTRLKVSLADWDTQRDGTPNFMKAANKPYSCAGWIQANPSDFRIDPGQAIDVRYTISVPKEIEDGGFRAAIMIETVPDVTVGQKARSVYMKGRIAVIVYEKAGNPVIQGFASSLKANLKKKEIDFSLSLKNTGKTHFRTKGSITVKDSNGKNAFEVPLPDVPVLPESERDIKVSYDKDVPAGKYMATAVIDIGKNELIGAETSFEVK